MNIGLFFSVFGSIFLAELPDKTALASLVLATRYKPLAVWVGAALAFLVQTIVAVAVGGLFSLLPEWVTHRGAGVLFLVFAVLMWIRNEDDEEKKAEADAAQGAHFRQGVWASFLAIFVAEWGDLTQLATATLTAKYNDPLTIFVAALLALWAVAALAILVGLF
jgi:putative Ca2+/H+ antiporter (TMEM165/GDT1 family)